MKQQIIDLVNERHISSAGKCGTYLTEFGFKLKISASKLKELITELRNDGEVQVRNGINGFMVMKTPKRNEKR